MFAYIYASKYQQAINNTIM